MSNEGYSQVQESLAEQKVVLPGVSAAAVCSGCGCNCCTCWCLGTCRPLGPSASAGFSRDESCSRRKGKARHIGFIHAVRISQTTTNIYSRFTFRKTFFFLVSHTHTFAPQLFMVSCGIRNKLKWGRGGWPHTRLSKVLDHYELPGQLRSVFA